MPKQIQTLTHPDAVRTNIPTAELEPVMHEEDRQSIRVAYQRNAAWLEPVSSFVSTPASPQQRVAFTVLALLLAAACHLVSMAQASSAPPLPLVDHRLVVELKPQQGEILATDQLRLPAPQRTIDFALHRNLHPELTGPGQLSRIAAQGHLIQYRAQLPAPSERIELRYQGRIQHELQDLQQGMGRSLQQSPGTIGANGVFLSGHTGWYPRIADSLESFTLSVRLPPGWRAISQGEGPGKLAGEGSAHTNNQTQWREPHPQDEMYLIAAPFQFYRQPVASQPAGAVDIQAWLRAEDATLAERYLAATGAYLDRYSALIGAYPYAKFALVENFWETGYGMPSFTLLGPRVLRLPFILHSSYPHEILHNWWGNGVFVDWDSGNWSEGLTAYLADHLNQALAGRGSRYRHDQLKAYADFVRAGTDHPLSAFRARHSQASQAIGYGKSLMVFHMLRRLLGDEDFIFGLRRFYAENLFRHAGWAEVRQAFEQTSGRDLNAFFSAWVQRPGAPRLRLENPQVHKRADGGYRVSALVRQTQAEAVFPLRVPVIVHDIQGQPHEHWLDFTKERAQGLNLELNSAPLRLAVDPLFDTFRALEPGETPVSLSRLFGAPAGTLILPAQAPDDLRRAYQELARSWQRGQAQWRLIEDAELEELPSGPVWLMGWENRFLPAFSADSPDFRIAIEQREVSLNDQNYQGLSPVLTRDLRASDHSASDSRTQPVGWLAAAEVAAVAGLARKLPHYGKYGVLLFSGNEPKNVVKDQWSAHASPLLHWFADPWPEMARDQATHERWASLRPLSRPSLLESLPNLPPAPPHSAGVPRAR